MNRKLRILNLEDSQNDSELIRAALEEYGIDCDLVRVDTKQAYLSALEAGRFDLILADYSLPGFDGMAALEMSRGRGIPFLFVSGAIGEDLAIEALRSGATDYVFKHKPDKLGPAVSRALREAEERTERRAAEEDLRKSREKLRSLSAHLETVREEERARIAREIHDELGQALTVLKMETAALLKSDLPEKAFMKAVRMSSLLDSAIVSTKRIVTQLRPSVLDHLGLVAALEWQARDFAERTGIVCEFVSGIDDISLNQERATAVFRIFQETLTNIARHSGATRAEASLDAADGRILLSLRDNGKGISEHEIRKADSFGIIGMSERARFLGGDVRIEGSPGEGTSVTLIMPLEAEHKSPDRSGAGTGTGTGTGSTQMPPNPLA